MSPEEIELLKKSVSLAEENNAMLRSMKRSMRISHVMSIAYWLVIIGISIGAFYFIQPYLSQLMSIYGGAGDVLKNFQSQK